MPKVLRSTRMKNLLVLRCLHSPEFLFKKTCWRLLTTNCWLFDNDLLIGVLNEWYLWRQSYWAGDLCFVHPIFLTLGFWYIGYFSCVIFFSFFLFAYLTLQNVNKDYRISSYSFRPWIVSSPLCTATFDLMYCDLWVFKSKKE